MKKLIDEVCGAFKSETELDSRSVSTLPYLVACVNETLRIYPASLGGSAVVVPPGGDTIGTHWVPGGVSLILFLLILEPSRPLIEIAPCRHLTSCLDWSFLQYVRSLPLRTKFQRPRHVCPGEVAWRSSVCV